MTERITFGSGREGKVFCDSNLPSALRQAQEYAGRKGYVPSLPQLIDLRLKANKEDPLWDNRITTTTEEHIGKTKKGNPVLVTSHKQAIWTPDRIDWAYKDGLINEGAGKLTQLEFYRLLEAEVTVTDLYKVENLPSDYQYLEDLRKDPLFILRVGSKERANAYLDKLKELGYNRYRNRHSFKPLNIDQPHGRLLFISRYCGGQASYVRIQTYRR